jgi:hypothetical protein
MMASPLVDVLVGSVLPPVIDVFNAKFVDSRMRFWFSIAVTIVVAVIINFDEFKYHEPQTFLASILTVIVSAQAVYAKLYKDSKMQNTIRQGAE